MRLTIIAIGSRGDVQPYVALGEGLRWAGHDVRLATHPAFEALAVAHGLEFAAVAEGALSRGPDTRAGRAWVQRGSRVLPSWVGLLQDAASVAEQRLADCARATQDADAIVVSVLGTLLGRQLAAQRGVPMVRAYYAPPSSIVHRRAARQALWLCYRPWVNRARRAALGLPPLGRRDPLVGLDRSDSPVLYGFSPAVVPPSRVPGDAVEVTGYWLLDEPAQWTPPAELATFLAAGDAPVLITFGSMADRRPERTTALLLEALARAGRRAILIRGPHLAPGVELPPDVLAVDSVPYGWLFPRLAAAVHHGGAGTSAYAIRAGVPSVVIPAYADQPFWAERIRTLGLGPPPIPRKELTADRLAAAIHAAATDGGVRQRSAALAADVAAEDGVAVAVAAVERQVGARAVGERDRIATRPRPACPLCGSRGVACYRSVRDRLFDAPGSWDVARCPAPGCGMLWLDPVPTEADIGKAYRTYYTHARGTPPRARPFLGPLSALRGAYLHRALGYAPSGGRGARAAAGLVRVFPGGRDAMADTACHLAPPPAPGRARLLEVGFGSGDQLARMQDLGWQVTGVDVDPVAVATARERALDVHEGTLAEQRFAAGRFDAIYLSHVLEHVHDPLELLRECHRVLVAGGTLVAITPNADSRTHRRFGAAWFALEPPRHLTLFTPWALRTAALRAGFPDAVVRTSARIAFIASIGSADIRDGGRVVSFDGAVPLGRLTRGIAAQVAEAALLRARPDAGEELLLKAQRPAIPPVPRDTDEKEEARCTPVSPSLA